MKRIELFLLAVVMAFGLAGCGGGDSSSPAAPTVTYDITGNWHVTITGSNAANDLALKQSGGTVTGTETNAKPGLEIVHVTGSRVGDGPKYEMNSRSEIFWPDHYFFGAINYHVTLNNNEFVGTCDVSDPDGKLVTGLACRGDRI